MTKNIRGILFLTLLFLISCKEEAVSPKQVQQLAINIVGELPAEMEFIDGDFAQSHQHQHQQRSTSFTETFEAASKGSYSAGSVSANAGSWYLSDALIGTLSADRKYNSKSARIRNAGYAMMSFNMDNGVSTVKVRHAKYGSDGNSSWRLIYSNDNGNSWYYIGSTVNTTSTSLNTVSFTMNQTGAVRFGIYKTGGGSARINVDNIEVTAYNGGSTGGGTMGSASRDNNLTFGNPSDAATSSSSNYLINRADYALSYNNSRGTANWVSWHLSTAWTGSASRCNCFKQDTALPSNYFRATTSDYTGSGYDRGHLCPSADRTYTSSANSNTFYMTNIAPQAADNNQRSWASLEDYCRTLASQGNELHIIAGVAGTGGTGKNGYNTTIDGGNITVPDSFWKVILVLPNGSSDVSRVTTATRVIAVNIPNDQGINTNWSSYRTTVNAIESITGLDLFENITNTIESTLESRVDNGPTN